MADELRKVGVRAVVENAAGFQKGIDAVNKSIDEIGKQAQSSVKKMVPFGDQLDSLTGVFSKIPVGAAIAAAAIAAVGKALLDLAVRGAALRGLAESFDRLTASVGVASKTMLEDLRAAAAGTVSDFDLIRQANFALAGAVGDFGTLFAQKLPTLLQIARAQARATGQDVDYLFQSLVLGVKRSSPLLIDNTGLVLKVSQANQDYADKIGKTVEQLTAQEKQIALLNAVVDAGQVAINGLGTSQETAAEKIARAQATISNIFDTLGLALQPGFEAIMDGVNRVVQVISDSVKYIAPVISVIGLIVGKIIEYALSVISIIMNIARGLTQPLLDGAKAAFGAFGRGMAWAANNVIFPVLITITRTIADFLVGQSPPPKGPLSDIDKGGKNTMLAWLQGFASTGIEPVQNVVQQVATAMGNVAGTGADAIASRLKVLDAALLPFQQRLDIVQSQFEAIQAPAKAALDAIDRQLQAATDALAAGEVGADERVRALDAQRQAIQDAVDAQQAQVDNATVQLALVKAQQAQERALLNIRKEQLPVEEKVTKERKKSSGAAAPAVTEAAVGGVGMPKMPKAEDSVMTEFGAGASVTDFLGLDQTTLDQLSQNASALGTQFSRLGDLGSATGGVAGKFNEFGRLFDFNDPSSPLGIIKNNIDDLFDPSSPNSISAALNNFGDSLASSPLVQSVKNFFSGIFDPNVQGSPAQIVRQLVTDLLSAESPTGIINAFTNFGTNLLNSPVVGNVLAFLNNIFNPAIMGSPAQIVVDLVDGLINPNREGSIPYFFGTLPQKVSDAAQGLFALFDTNVIGPVRNFLTGTGEGTLSGILDSAIAFFTAIPGRVVGALQSLGLFLWNALAVPVINIINSMIGLVESGIRSLQSTIELMVNNIAAGLGTAVAIAKGNEDEGLQAALNFKAGFGEIFNPVQFGRISTAPPGWLTATTPGAASGGLFSGGLLKVGERGQELMANASRTAVFPNTFVQALEGLTRVLAQPMPMPLPVGGSVTNNTDNSMVNNFNGVQGSEDVMRRFNALQAIR